MVARARNAMRNGFGNVDPVKKVLDAQFH